MTKYLKVSFPEKCIGCEMCVFEAQRQLNTVGLEGAQIRILKNKNGNSLTFTVEVDPKINTLDIKKIEKICPKGVFTVEERTDEDGLVS